MSSDVTFTDLLIYEAEQEDAMQPIDESELMITCPRCDGKGETHGIMCGPGSCRTGAMKCFTCKGEGRITKEHDARIAVGRQMRKGRIARRVVTREEAKRLSVDFAEWSQIEQGDEPKTEAGRRTYDLRLSELDGEQAAEDAKAAEAERHGVKCFCGVPMTPLGQGAYPYDCIAKRDHPNDIIYKAQDCGHGGWTHRAPTPEKCYGCDQVKVYSGEFCDDCLEAWKDEPPEQIY